MIELKPFQRRFVKRAFAPGITTAAMSLPRGNGKSTLSAWILARCLTPGDPWHKPGAEYLLGAASIEQARMTIFKAIREHLEPTGEYRFLDSAQRIGITHKSTNTRLRVLSSNAKAAQGIVGVPLIVLDEPGAYEVGGGTAMYDAVQTAQGKPDSELRALYVGTLAPSLGGWWHELVKDGSHGSTYVQALQGRADKWASSREIARVNPLMWAFPNSRAKLLEERDAAYKDSRLKARFLSFRENLPTQDEATMLLSVDDWELATAREVPDAEGRPVVGWDSGNGRAWSAAVALWPSGRCAAMALAPGIPDLQTQERRDRVHPGTYLRLYQSGQLAVAEGLRVQLPGQLVQMIAHKWGRPAVVVSDLFQHDRLVDAAPRNWRFITRRPLWSQASEDVRALRKLVKDGPLAVDADSVGLIEASLAASMVENDSSGNTRLIKRDPVNNTGRDDVSASLILAAGELERRGLQRRTFRSWGQDDG